MYALIDCNNFYASCERLFRPDLQGKPIVVLSSNDGCVIARSNEAKALGIGMGEPFFKIKNMMEHYQLHVFSSNFALYGDLSQRVMSVIEATWPEVEIYSIDEAFLDLSALPEHLLDSFCTALQKNILQATGIPTSIGIGKTKSLAKIANHVCKKILKVPVFNIQGQEDWLAKINIGDVWGVGRRWRKKLMEKGINTANDLALMNPTLLKQQFNVVLMRTAMELQGIKCLSLEEAEARKSIISSKSFGEMQTEISSLAQALSSHCARACEKARSQNLVAQRLAIFIRGNPYRQDLKQYSNSMECYLINPSDDTRVITAMAKLCLEKIFKAGIQYKKVGVMLGDLIHKSQIQLDLFEQANDELLAKKDQLMTVFDAINHRYGKRLIKLAAEGYSRPWATLCERRSPCYTTSWNDLPIVRA